MNPRDILRQITTRAHALVFQAAIEGKPPDPAEAERQAVREAAEALGQERDLLTASKRLANCNWLTDYIERKAARRREDEAEARLFEEEIELTAARLLGRSLSQVIDKPEPPAVEIAKPSLPEPRAKPAAEQRKDALGLDPGLVYGGGRRVINLNDEFPQSLATSNWRAQQH